MEETKEELPKKCVSERTKEIYLDLFRKCCTSGSFILVMDERTMPCLQKAVSKLELMGEGCSTIENLHNYREPEIESEAIYLLEPSKKNMDVLLKEYDMVEATYKPDNCCEKCLYGEFKLPAQKLNKYGKINLIFQGALNEQLFERVKANKVLLQHLASMKEINADFQVIERNVFTLGQTTGMENLWGQRGDGPGMIRAIGRQLMNLCVTMNEYPFVRYRAGYPCEEIANSFQTQIENYQRSHDKWQFHTDRATLFIVDRTADPLAPFLHEFSYQAMIYDLLPIVNDTYTYMAETGIGPVEKKVVLNETDSMWVKYKHTFILETQRQLQTELKAFLEENKDYAQLASGDRDGMDLEKMNKLLPGLQDYQNRISIFSRHINIAKACMSVFDKSKIHPVALIEQTLATGYDQDKRIVKVSELYKNLQMRFADPEMSIESKVRLLALFLITQDGVKEEWRNKLVDIGKIGPGWETALANLRLLGISTLVDKPCPKRSPNPSGKGLKGSDESMLSRFNPIMKDLLMGEINRTLSQDDYPYIVEPPPKALKTPPKGGGGFSAAATSSDAKSRRTKKAGPAVTTSWAAKGGGGKEERHVFEGPRCIFFIAGGMTYSEMRVAAEVEKELNISEVIIGSTHIITPVKFMEDLKTLDPEIKIDM